MAISQIAPTFSVPDTTSSPANNNGRVTSWQAELGWIAIIAGVGALVTLISSNWLQLPRPWVVSVLVIAVSGLTSAYLRWSGIELVPMVQRRWLWALVRGLLLGLVLIALALPNDESAPDHGARLLFDMVWLGIVYGIFESLLINVLPMTVMWRVATLLGWTTTIRGKVGSSVLTLGSGLFVTAAYHLGYPEFRGLDIVGPLSGNFLIGVGYVLAPNPLTTIISHVILHVAAVLGGTNGTYQLPPHY